MQDLGERSLHDHVAKDNQRTIVGGDGAGKNTTVTRWKGILAQQERAATGIVPEAGKYMWAGNGDYLHRS